VTEITTLFRHVKVLYLTLMAGGTENFNIYYPIPPVVMSVVNKGYLFHEPDLLCGKSGLSDIVAF
jgi:hypothetical protein